MKYHKPSVAVLAAATDAIQLTRKDDSSVFDGTTLPKLSMNAYEADE